MDQAEGDAEHINCAATNVPDAPSNKRSIGKKKRIEALIDRYNGVIDKLTDGIELIGNSDLDANNLLDDDNVFVKLDKLETNLLKARRMLLFLERKLKVLTDAKANGKSTDDAADTLNRPIEYKARYKGSGFVTIDASVTKFINRSKRKYDPLHNLNMSKAFYDFPSTGDIFTIINKENESSKIGMDNEAIESLAKKVCTDVITLLKKYTVSERKQFLMDVCDESENNDDPAKNDQVLAEKLANNKRIALLNQNNALEAFEQSVSSTYIDESVLLPESVRKELEEIHQENSIILTPALNSVKSEYSENEAKVENLVLPKSDETYVENILEKPIIDQSKSVKTENRTIEIIDLLDD